MMEGSTSKRPRDQFVNLSASRYVYVARRCCSPFCDSRASGWSCRALSPGTIGRDVIEETQECFFAFENEGGVICRLAAGSKIVETAVIGSRTDASGI
jgi:hypothetical protein